MRNLEGKMDNLNLFKMAGTLEDEKFGGENESFEFVQDGRHAGREGTDHQSEH